MSSNTVYLIDGTALCYRSFFAINLSTSKGFPSGAIYGFAKTLKKIIKDHNPRYIGVCFDVSRKTFRQEKFREYKITRPPVPEGLKSQIPLIKELVSLYRIKLIEKEGLEADDIIASLTHDALKENFSVVIVTSDKDMYQLLDNKDVKIYNPQKDKVTNASDFLKEFGFLPSRIIDYLSLAGDSSDNIPGAKGIGKVGAAKLIQEFGTIENIFNNLDKTPVKLKNILAQSKDDIFLSKELVQLRISDLNVKCRDLIIREPDYEGIFKMFTNLEFKGLIKELPLSQRPGSGLEINVISPTVSSLNKENLKDLALYIDKDTAYFLINKDIYKVPIEQAKDILEDESIKKISFDFKDQLGNIGGINLSGIFFDVKVSAYLLDPSSSEYTLAAIVSNYLDKAISDINIEYYPYYIDALYKIFAEKIKQTGLENLFFNVEMPLVSILHGMQRAGVAIDSKVLGDLLGRVGLKIDEIKKEIFKEAKKEFNINSPKQLQAVLFEDLKIKPIKKTKTGYSTNEDVLQKLSAKHLIARLLLEYRQLYKLMTTYIEPLKEHIRIHNGRLHAAFNQTATQTGRLSSSSPNLQSIPQKGEFSNWLRKAFIPSGQDSFMLSADYSQIELRILAHFSNDQRLKQAFNTGSDIHAYTASLLFALDEEKVESGQRDIAKRVNFAILYGMSAYGLSQELNIDFKQAESFIEDYFSRYPGVKDYIERVYKQVDEKGYVNTLLGRRRYLPDFNSHNIGVREFARRQAVNTPIQGSCADLIKVAMVKIYNEFKNNKLSANMIIQIHDELLFDVPKHEIENVGILVEEIMENSIKLSVPIKVNLKAGKNWGEMEEMTNYK
ncbi:MAG: DNA polymerase I [Candidatus Omnitrophota bacterium]